MDSITMPNYMNRLDLIKFISETTDKYISSKEMEKVINKVCGGYGEFGDNNYKWTLIRNIHVKNDSIEFTHSNDIDVVYTMDHGEVGHRGNNKIFIKRLEKLNLDNEIQLYNSELIWARTDVNIKPLKSFDAFLTALVELGYRINHNSISIWGSNILHLKKNEC